MKKNIFLRAGLLVSIIAGLLLMGCPRPTVPSLVQGGRQPHLPGKFVWYDLFTDDLAAAEEFYRELFGWEFADAGFKGDRVKTIRLNGAAIANAVEVDLPGDGSKEPRWLGYISVEDVDRAVGTVKELGGRVHLAPKEIPHRGRVAVVFDPQGAVFALVHSSVGDPPDKQPVKHQLIGSELWTNDLAAALSFYGTVTDYAELPVLMQNGRTYRLLAASGRPRAGIAEILWDDVQPNWVAYIVVENVAETVAKAEDLGGRLLLGLRDENSESTTAILSDPTGGIFGVQQVWATEEVQP